MNKEGRFFGTLEALADDVLRYNARLDYMVLITAMKAHQRMVFEDGKISWHLIEKYEDVWDVSGAKFTQITLDVSMGQLLSSDKGGLSKAVGYLMSRVRGTTNDQS